MVQNNSDQKKNTIKSAAAPMAISVTISHIERCRRLRTLARIGSCPRQGLRAQEPEPSSKTCKNQHVTWRVAYRIFSVRLSPIQKVIHRHPHPQNLITENLCPSGYCRAFLVRRSYTHRNPIRPNPGPRLQAKPTKLCELRIVRDCQ